MINPDLVKERESATFNVEDFAKWWAGGKPQLDEQRSLQKAFFDDPEFVDATNVAYLSHVELYEYAVKKSTRFIQKLQDFLAANKSTTDEDDISAMYKIRGIISGPIGVGLFPQNNPLRLHFSMFLPTIVNQGTEEQRKEWLPKAWRCEILGTYAQTELGHDIYIRGLETRADYDIDREEFILNSPTMTSCKWCPGNLGQTSNYVILMAQLFVGQNNHGVHAFLVQIRSLENHLPLPGVEVGEIGPKLGMNGVNNGFLRLKNVRIPRLQMLMKNAMVHCDGTFQRKGDPLLIFETMIYVRVAIIQDASNSIIQAATIATRYSAVRRQSPIDPNEPEPQILDHVTQQLKVFPEIAKGIIFKFVSDSLWNFYLEVGAEKKNNLPELHALSCCLKAVCSVDALKAIETLRMSCGGQGFLMSSNFPAIYANAVPACTYEGETTVLLLQTGRFLMKTWKDVLNGKPLPQTVAYLKKYEEVVKWHRSIYTPVKVFWRVASNKIRETYEFMEKMKINHSPDVAANLSGIRLTQAATLHARAFLASSAYDQIKTHTKKVPPKLAKVLWHLLELYLLDMLLANLAEVLLHITISAEDVESIQLRVQTLLAWIRPNAVAIVDGFDLHDRTLNSSLGAFDGRVYERLLEEAKKSPLNQEPVNQSYHKYLAPFMKAKL